jgi:hypothetical protein
MTTQPNASYSYTVRLEAPARGNAVSKLTRTVEDAGGEITALDVSGSGNDRLRIDVTIAAYSATATTSRWPTPPASPGSARRSRTTRRTCAG